MSRVLVHSNGDAAELSISSTTPSSSNVNGVSSNSSSNDSTNDVRRLQDEVNQLTKSRGGLILFFKFFFKFFYTNWIQMEWLCLMMWMMQNCCSSSTRSSSRARNCLRSRGTWSSTTTRRIKKSKILKRAIVTWSRRKKNSCG